MGVQIFIILISYLIDKLATICTPIFQVWFTYLQKFTEMLVKSNLAEK